MHYDFKIGTQKDGMVEITGNCIRTKKPIKMNVRIDGLKDYYEHGKKIQDAFPDLTPGQREFFISGLSEEGFNEITKVPEIMKGIWEIYKKKFKVPEGIASDDLKHAYYCGAADVFITVKHLELEKYTDQASINALMILENELEEFMK